MRVHLEERPAGISAVDTAFEPRYPLLSLSQYRINTDNLIIGMVRVPERSRGIECLLDALKRGNGLVAAGVQHPLHADDQRFVGVSAERQVQSLVGGIE